MASNLPPNGDFPLGFGRERSVRQGRIAIRWVAVVIALIFFFVALSFARSVYTDWLWYDSLGFRSVYVRILTARIALFAIGTALVGALLGANLYVANRLSAGPVVLPIPPEAEAILRRLVVLGAIAGLVILSITFGSVLASRWELFLRYAGAVPFGETEPVFNREISFYLFSLPTYNFLQGWLLGIGIVALLGALGMYFVNLSLRGLGFVPTTGLKVHISVIAAITMLIIAWGHWLDRWELLLSGHGVVFGATYADIHARKLALLVLTIVAIASSVLMLINAYQRGMRLLAGALVLWTVMAIALGAIWPALMQQFTVTPNEFAREAPYIKRNIEFTRRAFALDRIKDEFYPAETSVTRDLLQRNLQTINNIRLWDYRPLTNVYKQIQLIRPYYEFPDVDVDRYTIAGQYRQVMLAAREVDSGKLAPESQTWVNRKLFYTHGIGVAMSPVTEFTPEGRPEFFAKDIPVEGVIPVGLTTSRPEFVITNPRIYYGENTRDYVIVNTRTDELDYQTNEGEVRRTRYTGTGGVRLSSFLRRLAYAWQFGDLNILISDEITGDSRIQYRRHIQESISTVAPFLLLDHDPYIVATDGRLFWIQDAYMASDRYPYSEPFTEAFGYVRGGQSLTVQRSFNYIRNSVKVTVDAFDGTLRFYVWDAQDPLVKTYQRIFPGLFLPQEQMPALLRQHVRYPEDFFFIQARKYIRYHMQDPQNFYNNEDLWAVPREKFGQSTELQPIEPYYVNMRLPGEQREEFVLLLPYTPSQRQNLIGWLAARSDGENYGQLVAFNFPKDRQVDGPEQVEARIDNDQYISAWFTLRCAEGASCTRGNLLVIPIDNSLVYAEPVYIQARGVTFPELKQVILASGERVVMQGSLSDALAALTGERAIASTPTDGQTPGVPVAPPETVQGEIESLRRAIEGLKENLLRLEEALQRLRQLTGGE